MKLRALKDLPLEDKRVFLRLDLNVPLVEGKITSDARIIAALPTIKHVLESGAKVALASHLGRPKGHRHPALSLEPVGARLSELLDRDVTVADDCIGDGVKALMRDAKPGRIVLLENLRFHSGETAGDVAFARALAAPFEVYVNDAFGACHRAHASIVGMVERFEHRAAGFLLEREVSALNKLIEAPSKPFVAVVGGAKVSDKIGVLDALLNKVDALCIGGAMAYTFLKAQGLGIGKSRLEDSKLAAARSLLERAQRRSIAVILPEDHVVAERFEQNAPAQVLTTAHIPEDMMGLDIGPKTRTKFSEHIRQAKSVFWNGPMGVFEWQSFAAGTMAIAEAVAACPGYTVVGGGDSVAAIEAAGVAEQISHVSTGGGASLELLEHGTLPGLRVLA